MKKGTRKQRKEAFIAAYKEGLKKQGLLDTKLDEIVAKKEEKIVKDVPIKKSTTKKKED